MYLPSAVTLGGASDGGAAPPSSRECVEYVAL